MKHFAKRVDILHVRIPEFHGLIMAGVVFGETLNTSKHSPRNCISREESKTGRDILVISGVVVVVVVIVLLIRIGHFTQVAFPGIKQKDVIDIA
jgi:Na+/pantothenate symporter